VVREKLRDSKGEIRLAAVKTVSNRGLRFGDELISLLYDEEPLVREWSRETLLRLARGKDFGPPRGSSREKYQEAASRWREWWDKQAKR
jgi:hypothetical protein